GLGLSALGLRLGGFRGFGFLSLLALWLLAALGLCFGQRSGALSGPLLGLDLVSGRLLAAGDRFERDRAALCFHRLASAWRGAGHCEGDLAFAPPGAKRAPALLGAGDRPRLSERLDGDRLRAIERAGVDRALNLGEIELVEFLGEDVVEAALGQAPMKRHLAAFETFDGDAGAGLLALGAFARRLA